MMTTAIFNGVFDGSKKKVVKEMQGAL